MSTTNINIPKPVIDYNDLDNKPTLVTEHSQLNLDDGTNPHGTTKADVGLSNVDNTSDLNKPISTDTQTALDLKANDADISAVGFSNDYNDLNNKPTIPTILDKHSELTLDDGTNPHGTTKSDVGLGNVPNLDTTDAVNKAHDSVTLTGTPNYLTIVGQAITRGLIDLANHVTNRLSFNHLPTGTAHSVVGRSGSGNGDLDNISAGNNTILGRSGSGDVAFNSATETKQILSLENVDNTSDVNKPISTATQTALDLKANDADISAVGFSNDYNDLDNLPTLVTQHSGLTLDDGTNPHGTTKSDVGLSNVDNTSDLNKPISTATQTELDLKQDTLVSGTNIKTINNTSLLGSGNIDTASVNPTSGKVPVNLNGEFVDSPISKISQGINIDDRTYTKGLYVQDYSSQFDSIGMRNGTILNFDSFTGDFIFGNFSFPFIKANYYPSYLRLSADGMNSHLNIDSSGNVGIGTTFPSAKLEVDGNIKVKDSLTLSDNSFAGTLRLFMGAFSVFQFNQSTADLIVGDDFNQFLRGNIFNSTLSLSNGGTTSDIFINAANNVGIGTTSPSEKLDVNGTLKAQGYKSSDGSAGVTQNVNTLGVNTLVIKNGIITQVL